MYGFLKNLRFFEPFLILFFLEKGLDFFQIGLLYAIRELTRNLLEIPAGVFADVRGRRKSMIMAFSCYILSFIIFYFQSVFAMFIPAMLLFAFGDAFRTGTHKAMIFEYLRIKGWQDQKVHYYGHTRSWSQIGSAVSSLIAAAIVFHSGSYSSIFLFTLIPYILDLLLMISYPQSLEGSSKNKNQKIRDSFREVFKDFIRSLGKKNIRRGLINVSIFSAYFKAMKDYLQPLVKTAALSLPFFLNFEDKERSALLIGSIYFCLYFITSYSSRSSGRLAGIFSSKSKALNISLMIGFFAGIAGGILYSLDFFILGIMIYVGIFIVENIRRPLGVAYITDILDKDILATALSVESQIKTVFAVIIAPLLGFLADIIGLGYAIAGVSLSLIIFLPLYKINEQRKVGLKASR